MTDHQKPSLPSHHLPHGKGFINPWPSFDRSWNASVWTFLKMRFFGEWRSVDVAQHNPFPQMTPDWEAISPSVPCPQHSHLAPPGRRSSSSSSLITAPTICKCNQPGTLRATWAGHSTFLIEMDGHTILTDPICSARCSASQYVGPKRYQDPPTDFIQRLPDHISVVLISHNHYDHLDTNTVRQLKDKAQLWAVPLGIKKWLVHSAGINKDKIVEMDWWDEHRIIINSQNNNNNNKQGVIGPPSVGLGQVTGQRGITEYATGLVATSHPDQTMTVTSDPANFPAAAAAAPPPPHGQPDDIVLGPDADLLVACTPCQHFSGRTLWDSNETLWSSWVVHTARFRFYFAGDTGYRSVPQRQPPMSIAEEKASLPVCPAFAEIGHRYGPFDLSCLPIGAYSPRYFMSRVHLSPEDAVDVHFDLNSRLSIGCHWGAFILTDEPIDEPKTRLEQAKKQANLRPDEFITLQHGETRDLTQDSRAPPATS